MTSITPAPSSITTQTWADDDFKPSLLVIDDEPENIRLFSRLLTRVGYTNLTTLTDSTRVLEMHSQCKPDLVLLDVHMPESDGFDVLEQLAPYITGADRLPVVIITGDGSSEIKRRAFSLGAKDFINKPFDLSEVVVRIKNLLETRLLHQTLRRHNAQLENTVAARTRQVEASQVEMLERLAVAVEFRDDDTGDHTRRVGALAANLAEGIGLDPSVVELIRRGAPLHDIGKVGIPDAILRKPGPLTPEERTVMETHTTIGSAMLANGGSELVRLSQRIAQSHHERWDGSGYPDRLVGVSIPIEARIVAVADFLDAVTHASPYRTAWPLHEALETIAAASGSHFDPTVVKALLRPETVASAKALFA
jgi:putative two-component system response regulator